MFIFIELYTSLVSFQGMQPDGISFFLVSIFHSLPFIGEQCVCVYVHTHTHTYAHILYIHIYMRTYIFTYIYIFMYQQRDIVNDHLRKLCILVPCSELVL